VTGSATLDAVAGVVLGTTAPAGDAAAAAR
jgi:hypothetical protein